MAYSQPGGPASGISASHAAAQLGMSAGPGSLFPIVASEHAPAGGMSMLPSVTPNYDQRFGSVNDGRCFVAKEMVFGRFEEALRLALATLC